MGRVWRGQVLPEQGCCGGVDGNQRGRLGFSPAQSRPIPPQIPAAPKAPEQLRSAATAAVGDSEVALTLAGDRIKPEVQ